MSLKSVPFLPPFRPRLGLNIDHVATLRQARGGVEPDPVEAAVIAEHAGVEQITVHLRADRRHIIDRDLRVLRQLVKTEINLEMACTAEMLGIAEEVRPETVTLVPETPQERTTEGGLDVLGHREELQAGIARLNAAGIRVSLFVDPIAEIVQASHEVGAQAIEIHTGDYARLALKGEQEAVYETILQAALQAHELGLFIAAGHGLNLRNVAPIAAIDVIGELNIGHSIISRSVFVGLEAAILEMLEAMSVR